MTNNINHIENQPEFTPEVMEVISGTRIAWSKTREEIWPEMLAKIEGTGSAKRNTKTISLQIIRYAAAAIITLLIGIPSVMYFYTKKIETQLAQTEIFLPDNSRVNVFAQSTLTYKPLLWKFSRSVKLEGEGFFEVQKGKKFEVVSLKGKTVVLGTQFDVYARNDEYNVTCTSGKVRVIESAHQNNVIITAGQKAILKPDGNFEIVDKTNAQPEETIKLQNQSLEEELNTVLASPADQEQSIKNEENKQATDRQTTAKEKTLESKLDNPIEQNAIKEQNRVQNQAVEATQNKGQTKAPAQIQAGDKEQTQNQEKTQGQDSENSPVKDKFRASLTPEQVSILENQQMSKEEKRKAFMQSLSPEQKQLLKEQNEERAKQAEANKKGATESENMKDQQKSQVREQMRESSGKENKEQQKQQNRENKGNTQPGGGNNPNSGSGAGGDNKNQTGKGN
jgi:hypothetical protein